MCFLDKYTLYLSWAIFHILSIFLSWQDLKEQQISALPFLICLFFLCMIITSEFLYFPPNIGIFIFLSILLGYFLIKKHAPMAGADIFYTMGCLWIIDDLWPLFFISIGIFSIFFHLILYKFQDFFGYNFFFKSDKKTVSFLPVTYASFIFNLFLNYI